jgi:ATP phosphoribosyltransferase regulatory subunit
MIDLSFVGHMGYYSGVVFEGMAEHVGFPVLNGGRYDDLMVQFGRPAAATGFALKTDRIMEASSLPHPTRRHHLVLYDEASSIAAVQKALDLRENGNVAVELRRLDQHKQAAGQANADVTVIRGGE